MEALARGLLLALALILPIGPQNAFVLARGAQAQRFREALAVVLVASVSDTLLIAVAVAGASILLLGLPWLRAVLSAAGIGYILVIGARFWSTANPDALALAEAPPPLRSDILQGLSVSLLNPHAILDTVGIIGAASAQFTSPADRVAFAAGAVLVSWVWFFALALFGRALGVTDGTGRLRFYLQRASAVLMWAIGLRMAWVLIAGA